MGHQTLHHRFMERLSALPAALCERLCFEITEISAMSNLADVAVRCFGDVVTVMGIQTVAEYVDKAPVLERVKELGITRAQGFFLHKPEPIERLQTRP